MRFNKGDSVMQCTAHRLSVVWRPYVQNGGRALNSELLRFLNEISSKKCFSVGTFSSIVLRTCVLWHTTCLWKETAFAWNISWQPYNYDHLVNDKLYSRPRLPSLTGRTNAFCLCCPNSAALINSLQQVTQPGKPRGIQNTPIGNQNKRQ